VFGSFVERAGQNFQQPLPFGEIAALRLTERHVGGMVPRDGLRVVAPHAVGLARGTTGPGEPVVPGGPSGQNAFPFPERAARSGELGHFGDGDHSQSVARAGGGVAGAGLAPCRTPGWAPPRRGDPAIAHTRRVKRQTLENWVWILVYGGLILSCFGVFVRRGNAGLGLGMLAVGALAAIAGFALIYVRSRWKDD
jgi:hypothetical protein